MMETGKSSSSTCATFGFGAVDETLAHNSVKQITLNITLMTISCSRLISICSAENPNIYSLNQILAISLIACLPAVSVSN